ncbi:alpha/beta fold hydrolase [Vibrio ziniensis]|uniref:Alpha/beta fold hydrolase n=1 Tax=Vibrio ziniensis TaxID=2711221 RepID=A0A6G7CLR3_9VIBR|nr:alpha/beta fold hydrolase [Vibrio ziniensis]QIH43042.1 alpha/beta fold hydrolase [Vibrio ziniensis]
MSQENTTNSSYTQEPNFSQLIEHDIKQLWQQREEGFLQSFDKKQLYWCKITSPQHTKAIVVVNGRIESCWKYQELFFDLFQQGFNIYSFDHRGQGLSARLIDNKQMGYVAEFQNYLTDMHDLIEHFNLSQYQQRFLLAHSMGGAVSARYLQTHPEHLFDAVAFSAPMFGINVPWQIRPIAITLTQVLAATASKPTYAPGYSDYYPKPFEDNPLTQSEVRYRWFRDLYEQKPELKLGGPSTHWVWQSLMAAKQCIQLTRQITIPTLVLQGGKDTVVSNAAQIKFIARLAKTNPNSKLLLINDAKHEILFEKDELRNQALDAILQHFANAGR